ncbi:MAG: YfhO family protein [Chloroflexi bacterium]|nr:YfhO family protein [Chloroflexota bacterium]
MINRRIPLSLVLLVLVLLALFPRLLGGEALFWGLPTLQFYPWRHFAFGELSAGRLPTWNPYSGAGAPLLANYQTAVFYPPNWLWLVLPDPLAMNLVALLHIVWAGVGMWLFTGSLGLTRFGRELSTLAFALGGYLMARLGSFPTVSAAAWIPWVFWLVGRCMKRRQPGDIGWLGLAFGLQLLSGHAQTTWYSCVGAGLYAVWLAVWVLPDRPRRTRGMALLLAGAGMALGVVIAAIQLVPTAELLLESDRSSGLDYKTTANLSYNPFRLFTLLSPDFYGTPADGSYLTEGIYFEDAAYIGFIPLVSALAAMIGRQRKRRRLDEFPAFRSVPLWTALVLGALLIALGRYGPVFRFLYDYVPTFDAFREPVRWLILPVFGLSVLAGIGVEQWGRGKWVVFWSRLAVAGGISSVIVALASRQFLDIDSENLEVLTLGFVVLGCWVVAAALFTLIQPQPDQPWLAHPDMWRGAVLLFVALDLAWAASGLNPTVPNDFFDESQASAGTGRIYWFEDHEYDVTFGSEADSADAAIEGYFDVADYRIATRRQDDLRTSLLPNLNMLDRVPALSNNEPMQVGHYAEYLRLIEDLHADPAVDPTPLLRAAGVTTLYGGSPPGWEYQTPLFEPDQEYAYAWLVPDAVWFADDDAIQDALRDPAWDPAQTVLLVGISPASSNTVPFTSGSVTLLESSPDEMRYRVTADGAAFLVISNTWYPGWEVTINGQDAEVFRANLAFQAVQMPPGESTITLRYKPSHWRWAIVASGTGALLALALIVAGWWLPTRRVSG